MHVPLHAAHNVSLGIMLLFVCSLIADFGHPVGRHGEEGEWGNTATAKWSVPEHFGGVDTVLGGPLHTGFTPNEKEGVG